MKNHHCLFLPLGIILVVIGAVTLVIFGIGNLEPYGYTRDFKETTCTVIWSNVTTYHTCDHINPSDTHQIIYSSGHSCLRVQVNYTEEKGGEQVVAYLYDSYDTLVSTRDYNITCAIHICREEVADNEEDVLEFQQTYGQDGDSYQCFYNPENTDEVFVYIVTSSYVLHALLWPALALGFGLFIIIVVIFSSCEVWVCMPWRNKREQQSTQGGGHHHHHHGAHHPQHHGGHKHSYELATVRYSNNHDEGKSTYKA